MFSAPQILAIMSWILPGYLGLYVFDLFVPASKRPELHTIFLSLALSMAGAGIAALLIQPEYLTHLFGAAQVSPKALIGTAAQMGWSIAVGFVLAMITKFVLKNRLGPRSAYPTAWDALWSEHGSERRCVVVELADGRVYMGTLAYADDPRIGQALALKAPCMWVDATKQYEPTGGEFTYFPADKICRVTLSPIETKKGEQSHERAEGTSEAGGDQGSNRGRVQQRATWLLPWSKRRTSEDDAGKLRQPESGRRPVSTSDHAND